MTTGVKPIVVIYIPKGLNIGDGRDTPYSLMQALNGNFGYPDNEKKVQYNDYWKDYLWFVFYDYNISTPKFEVFYPKDFTEIQYTELKSMIENALQQTKNQ